MICKVCNEDIVPILILENRKAKDSIYKCPKCKVGFVDPEPSKNDLNNYYNGMYRNLTVSFGLKQMNWARNSMKGYLKRLKWSKMECNSKTFLDLGGGLGYYSKAALEFGFSPILVEKDPISIDFAKNQLHLNPIIEKDLNDFFLTTSEKYDLVFFRHVIEHVTNPDEIIKNISLILKGNGILIIETDNNAGIEILFKKGVNKFYLDLYKKNYKDVSFLNLLIKRPFALDPPRHLFAFRMKNLSNLLLKNNIKPFIKDYYRLGHPIYWPNIPSPNIKNILRNFLQFKFRSGFIGIGDYSNLLFRIILQFFGLSSGLCIYARKED